MGWLELIGMLLAALLPVVAKWMPEPKSKGEKIRDDISSHSQAEKAFVESGDTSHLGKLPD